MTTELIVLNPSDRSWTRHSYVLWFDQHAPRYVLVYANGLDSALDECVDNYLEPEAPGMLVDDEVHAEYARAIAEGLSEDKAMERAEADTTTAGNSGRYLNCQDWGIVVENPTKARIIEIAKGRR